MVCDRVDDAVTNNNNQLFYYTLELDRIEAQMIRIDVRILN